MGNRLSIVQIDSFASEPFLGNPAAVCFCDNLNTSQMQNIAREMNLSETAFLSSSFIADYKIQWFTTACEVKLCGHATIASLHFLFEEGRLKNNDTITLETLSGVLKCGLRNGKYFMQIPLFDTEVYNGCQIEILSALQLKSTSLSSSFPFILTSNQYLYIYIDKLVDLSNLHPDFNALKKLSLSNLGFNCITVFTCETLEKGNDAHLRFFAPAFGINEDPVTGSANGLLLLVMQKIGLFNSDKIITKNFEQGDFTGRPGRIEVTLNKELNELYISGNAITVLKGEMIF